MLYAFLWQDYQFQSTLPAWGETQTVSHKFRLVKVISIHSPRMGRDNFVKFFNVFSFSISIHSPRMGRDSARSPPWSTAILFQSTLPAWGETMRVVSISNAQIISIHSPRMGRDGIIEATFKHRQGISIHSPRMGRDRVMAVAKSIEQISIHSPRMGRDGGALQRGPKPDDFNPLSPHGERRRPGRVPLQAGDFNPLSPHGERRGRYGPPLPGSDFNPLSPHGERLAVGDWAQYNCPISIHSPRMGRDARRSAVYLR